MARNLGPGVSTSFGSYGYAYDKVVFQKGKPPLDGELNLTQELQEIISQKSTSHLSSGWMSSRPFYTSNQLDNSFYTQDPEGSKPEVALVNGWPVYVTNTRTPLKHVNKIALNDSQLRSGSRTDGVFLEVWRALISPTESQSGVDPEVYDVVKPEPVTKISDLYGITMFNENIGWAVGNNAVILNTVDGGVTWVSGKVPVNVNYKKVKFLDTFVGFAIGAKGVIIKSIDGGKTWVELDTPIEDDLNDIYIIDAQHIVAVGDNGTILRTIDANNFVLVTEVSSNTDNLNGVYFYDTAVGWAIGDNGTLLITKDGGNIWTEYVVRDSRVNSTVTANLLSVGFYNLNDGLMVGENGVIYKTTDSGFTWVSMSDRIWVDGEYKSISELYPTMQIDFNKVFIKNEYPVKLTIAVYPDSKNYYKNLVYKISPNEYPGSFVLEYTGVQDNINYVNVLDLENYPTTESLRDAINALVSPYRSDDAYLPNADRVKIRVFEAAINYQGFNQPSDFRPTTGTFTSTYPADISFSVENKAWIAGSDGVALVSSNSGSKWEILDLGVSGDLNDVFYVTDSLGWYSGFDGTIIKYDPANISGNTEIQDTDLRAKSKGRIYPEGNILSEAQDYLIDDIISDAVGVETTKRVQIQYRIRVVDGVDPFNYPEAGLGQSYVFSQGPNVDTNVAGNYSYENMGEESGDYGLWRARCRNTVDGYSWSIPMFFVTRRNSGAFNEDTNINGSTFYDLNAIRPDALTYENIVDFDVTDIRRRVVVDSYSYYLQKNFDKLMSNRLKTNISDRSQSGDQYGTAIFNSDQYTGVTEINNLVRSGVSSEAKIVQDQKTLDPNILITEDELTFGPIDNGLYHNDPAYYSAYVLRDGVATEEPVQGNFEGLGTNSVKFNLAEDYTPAGGTLDGIEYQITAHYLNYAGVGLSRVPQDPISVKYISDPVNVINESYYFNAISYREPYKLYETLTENVSGYTDYTTIYSPTESLGNAEDLDLYGVQAEVTPDDPDYLRSFRKYKGQQFRGSLLEYHYYFKTEVTTNIIRIPKNLNGYTIYGVKKVKNVNGSSYKISSDFADDKSLRDRETINNQVVYDNMVVYLDDAYVIPPDNVVEVVLEATISPSVYGITGSGISITDVDDSITTHSKGEYEDALKTSMVSAFNVASKGVGGFYVGMLYPVTFNNLVNSFVVDLNDPNVSGLGEAIALGMSSYETKDSANQMYVLYKSNTPGSEYYSSVPVDTVAGFGTSTITVTLGPDKSINAGTVLIPLLLKLNTLPGLADTSTSSVFYRYVPYQGIGNLPAEMKVEILNTSDFVYVSNLGTGATPLVKGEPYEIPVEHIGINDDSIANDNMFSNIDDMDFNSFSIDTGFVKLPGIISENLAEDIILSEPNNVGDRLGRPFYKGCSQDVIFQAENLTLGTPRKVFVPMLARIRSQMVAPFLRGELVLLIFSKVYKARLENRTGFYEDNNIEYEPGYTEEAPTSISVYRLTNKPIVRK